MTDGSELMRKVGKLEAVERRWLFSVLVTMVVAAISVTIAAGHLDIGAILRSEHIQISATQLVILLTASAVILVVNIMVFVEYFAFEVRVERAVEVRKRKRSPPIHEKDDDEDTD